MNSTARLASRIVDWAQQISIEPLPPEFVAGSNDTERADLAALGSICGACLRDQDRHAIKSRAPEEILRWLTPAQVAFDLSEELRADLVNGGHAISLAYADLVSPDSRRRLGTFFTPPTIVEYALDVVSGVHASPDVIVDPGAGIGAFTIPAMRRWRSASAIAIDSNVVTLGLLACCWYTSDDAGLERLRLARRDYFDASPIIDESLGSRLYLGNPPYTRHQELDKKTKTKAFDAADGLVPSQLAGLSAYFLAYSLRQMREVDSLAMLLPANWLQTAYSRRLRDHLWSQRDRLVEVHTFDVDNRIFPDARVAASLLVVGPRRPSHQSLKFVEVASGGAVTQAETIEAKRSAEPLVDWGPVERRKSGKARRVSRSKELPISVLALRDIASVRRGVATGNNQFFLLDDRTAAGMPGFALQPVLGRARDLDGDLLDPSAFNRIGKLGGRRWLLNVEESDLGDARILRYINDGKERGIHLGELTSRRNLWYSLSDMTHVAPILVAPMGRSGFRIIENAMGAVHTNSLFGITPMSDSYRSDLLRWLRGNIGQQELINAARHLGTGLLKLEPRALSAVQVPSRLIRRH